MTDDLAALLDHLKVGPAYVLGWSDGGIEALLLGVRHPAKVKMIAAGAANLNPSDRALYPATLKLLDEMLAAVPDSVRATAQGKRELKVMGMMAKEPNIAPAMLEKIEPPPVSGSLGRLSFLELCASKATRKLGVTSHFALKPSEPSLYS